MRYRFGIAVASLILQAPLSQAQTPAFDVASVKLDAGCANRAGRGGGMPFSTGRLNMECTTLQDLIQAAYGVFGDGAGFNPSKAQIPISGGPSWIESEHYDLVAKAEGAARVEQMMGPMLRALLEDRFKLKIHRESKEAPVYALTAAKSGFKLQPVKEGGCIPIDLNHMPAPPGPGQPRPNFCGSISMRMNRQSMIMDVHGESLKAFAEGLWRFVERPVVDKTGIAGQFDFHLEFSRDESGAFPGRGGAGDAGNNAPSAAEGPSIFTALQEQLGLKLTSDKGAVESLVIDHVEKPGEN